MLPTAFGRTNRMGAPFVGSLAQSLIQVTLGGAVVAGVGVLVGQS